jgi:Big-like domain-containing protein
MIKNKHLGYVLALILALLLARAASGQINASGNPALVGQPVAFTLTIQPQNSVAVVPTGTVTFSDNGVNVGTVILQNGVATFTAVFDTPGDHTLEAVYSGDVNFQPSTADFIEHVSASNIFTLTATPAVLAQHAGDQSFVAVTVFQNATGNSPVHLTCEDLPPGVTCSFQTQDVTPTSGGATTALSISSTAQKQNASGSKSLPLYAAALAFALALLMMSNQRLLTLPFLCLCIFAVGCGDHLKLLQGPTPAGAYAVHVVGSDGVLTQQTTIQLTVQ